MKLTSSQLKKIIAEEVKAVRRSRKLAEVSSPEEVDMAKDRILRALGEARMELGELVDMTDDPDAMSAANDLDALMEFVTAITGTPA